MRNYFVGIGPFEKERFQLYDLDGNFIRSDGKYPFRGNDMDITTAFALYQGYLCANPNGNYFAISGYYCNSLEFYEIKENETILHARYEVADAKGRMNNNRLEIDDDCPIVYTGAYGTYKYCYVLYIGATSSETKTKTMPRKIVVFDWEGKYIRSYEPDPALFQFCVDEDNQCIYGLIRNEQHNGEYGIMRFKM